MPIPRGGVCTTICTLCYLAFFKLRTNHEAQQPGYKTIQIQLYAVLACSWCNSSVSTEMATAWPCYAGGREEGATRGCAAYWCGLLDGSV